MILGVRPAWLAEAARSRTYYRVFLLSDEVPWVNDGTRVLGGRRAEHTRRLRAELHSASQPFDELTGPFEARTDAAVRLVKTLVA
jgi:nicotinamide riboside kinase